MSGVPFALSNTPATSAGAGNTPSLGNVAAGTGPTSPVSAAAGGFNLLVGNSSGPSVVLDALHSVTTTKVLSNPSLVVLDNQVATLMVGNDVPISTGSATVLTANNSVVNTIDYRSIGLILRIAPRINANGSVRLEIEQEISQISSNANTTTPSFSQRKVKSAVGVQNGQTVLLAGLIQEQQESDRGGIPLVDQIQYLSDALSHQTKTGNRTELIIFIRPRIIRESQDAAFIAEELRSKLRGTLGSLPPDLPPASSKRR
jgi:general secretion pathway protein D